MAGQAPAPRIGDSIIHQKKGVFAKPSLTSIFQCWFYPTQASQQWIKERGYDYSGRGKVENISMLCHEASLPGSSLQTNEITNDFAGVTERHAYRRQYEDRADFTFYVDHNGADGGTSHDVIWFFEHWISSVMQESRTPVGDRPSTDQRNYFYRAAFPNYYQSNIYINKFERDFKGTYLEYNFAQAYPMAISSMPVQYAGSDVLKCTVSFTFTRYLMNRKYYGPFGRVRTSELLNDPWSFLNPIRGNESENVFESGERIIRNLQDFLNLGGINY